MKRWFAVLLVVAIVSVQTGNTLAAGIDLSKTTVVENRPPGTLVGYLSVAGATGCKYSVVAGGGQFQVLRDKLITKIMFDYERQLAYAVAVEAQCDGGVTLTARKTISILNVPD